MVRIVDLSALVATIVLFAIVAAVVWAVSRRRSFVLRVREWRSGRKEATAAFTRRAEARALLRKLVEARNEPDGDERRKLIDAALAPAVVIAVDGRTTSGRDDVERGFAHDHADQKYAVAIVAPVEARDDEVWTRWEVSGLHRTPVVQTVTARVDRSIDRLSEVTVTPADESSSPWKRVVDIVLGNPVAAVGFLGGATYLALRVPTQFFYARLGSTPDEVGLGPQVLVPQSLVLLLVLLLGSAFAYPMQMSKTWLTVKGIGRLWQQKRSAAMAAAGLEVLGVAMFLVGGAVLAVRAGEVELTVSGELAETPPPEWVPVIILLGALLGAIFLGPRLARPLVPGLGVAVAALAAERRRRRDRWERRSSAFALALSVAAGIMFMLSVVAVYSGAAVRNGADAGGELFPWRALPTTVDLKPTAARLELTNHCGELRYLGSADNKVVLYDTRRDRLFRIPAADASVSTDVGCLWIQLSTATQGSHCSGDGCVWDVGLSVVVSDDDADIEGVLSKLHCDDSDCRYRRYQKVDTNSLRLPEGTYRLTLTATEADRTAQQVIGVTVP